MNVAAAANDIFGAGHLHHVGTDLLVTSSDSPGDLQWRYTQGLKLYRVE